MDQSRWFNAANQGADLFLLRPVQAAFQAALSTGLQAFKEQALGNFLGGFGSDGDVDSVRSVELDDAVDCADVAWFVVDRVFVWHVRSIELIGMKNGAVAAPGR